MFVPYLEARAETSDHVDVVWDRYFKKSLNKSTTDTSGLGLRMWMMKYNVLRFSRLEENKTELFVFLLKCDV